MYLEEITYYKNICFPQFTPINYLLYSEQDDNIKAIILSELPAIFKKYNIPLHHDDLILFLNPNDNIARSYDLGCVIEGIDSCDEEERRDALLTRDFIYFYEKIKSINHDKLDRLYEKSINERYGYYYNKYDSNRFEKFKQHLNNNIPKSGFFNVEALTDKDIEMCKMDWLDYKEQKFRDYFYGVKMYFKDAPVKILSERFFRLYNILKDKYDEIEFSNVTLDNNHYSIKERASSIYLNDIIYEKSPKRFYKDYIPSVRFKDIVYDCYPEQFRKSFSKERWEEYKKQATKDYFKHKKMSFSPSDKIGYVIDTLEAERVILEQNGYKDATTLLPVLFQDYFRFSLKYEEEIGYFKGSLKDNPNKTLAIYNMINYYGVDNIPGELITYLISDNFIEHNTIKKVKVYSNKKTN